MELRVKTYLKMLKNLLLFVALLFLTFWSIFKDQDINKLINVLKSVNIFWILIGIFMMIIYYSFEAYNVRSILKILGDKISMLSSFKFTMIGFFFSSITPAASGGQPIEIYYMTKEKISCASATLALLIQVCGFQIATITYGIICSFFYWKIISKFFWLYLIGLTINGFALAVLLISIFSERLTKKLLNVIIKIMKFLRIRKSEVICKKIEEALKSYNKHAKFIKSHMKEFFKVVFRVFIQVIFYYSVPFCVYKSFGLNTYNVFQLFAMQAVVYTTVSSIPLPGAIGISETIFLSSFGIAFGEELLSGAMLLSRGISFYLFIIISILVVIVNIIKTRRVKGEIDKEIIKYESQF